MIIGREGKERRRRKEEKEVRTCFSCGVAMKMVCTSRRMSSSASRRSHSSKMKCFTWGR